MPGGWSKPRDIAKLADARAEFAYAIPCGELLGVVEGYSDSGEQIAVEVRFGRMQGLPYADVTLQGAVIALCQRCLRAMRLEVQGSSRVAVLDGASADAEVPEGWESFLAADGQVSVGELAAEELLLALPLVARHEPDEQCPAVAGHSITAGSAAQAAEAPAAEEPKQRPFAGLRALLEDAGRK